MCVHMCTYVYTFILFVHMCTYLISVYICVHMCTYVYMCVHVPHMCTYVYICEHMYTHVCICGKCVCVYICVHMCAYVCACRTYVLFSYGRKAWSNGRSYQLGPPKLKSSYLVQNSNLQVEICPPKITNRATPRTSQNGAPHVLQGAAAVAATCVPPRRRQSQSTTGALRPAPGRRAGVRRPGFPSGFASWLPER